MKTLFHRAAATAAALIAGMTGVAGLSTPAQAANGITFSGSATCVGSQWQVVWKIVNSDTQIGTITSLKAQPEPIDDLPNDGLIPRRSDSGTNGQVVFKQSLPGGTAFSSVAFTVRWTKGSTSNHSANVQLGACGPTTPPCVSADDARFSHTFAIAEGKATATVSVKDGQTLCDPEPVTLVTYFAPKPEFSVPQYKFASETATLSAGTPSVTLTADLPSCNVQADLFFGGEDDVIDEIVEGGPRYDNAKLGSTSGTGSRSAGPQGWYNGGDKACRTPAVEPVSTCDGDVDLNLSNTGELNRDVTFTIRAGEFSSTAVVANGEGRTVTVPHPGTTAITVTAEGMDDFTYVYEKPADCGGGGEPTPQPTASESDSPSPTPTATTTSPAPGQGGGDDEGGLPVTGAAAGAIAGGAAVLLLTGGVLFLLARRRKIKFTA